MNKNVDQALASAVKETMVCASLPKRDAEMKVRAVASQVLHLGDLSAEVTLGMIKFVVQKMGALPGQRTLILISPGFFAPDTSAEKSAIIDAAARRT